MGYIKKLKNNELVGGTDKTTIYPVTSTEAVFEEITNGSESSFKSQKTINKEQQDTLDAHNGRVTYLEGHAVKSVTINGGTKIYTVDDAGNVNLDVYTTESAEGQATLAEEVGDIRSIVGTKDSPASDTLVNRVGELETLVGGSGQGSVNTRIANAKAEILGDAAEDYNTLGKVEDKIQEEAARATAEETELSIYVHAIEGGNIRVKTSTPTNPDTGAPANTVYRVAGTTTYSDYMWNGTTMVKMAEYNVDTLESQFGYYKWETASNTISITTSNQVAGSPIGSYVLTTGGSFKIKMSNKATGACTLNMNGTGVKTLLYNGDPVASNNTWENDEVISVYYDGSVYQASNAQGGSNKKIDAYLLGDLRTLIVGQNYEKNEVIKTSDKQIVRVAKEIKPLSLKEEVAVGDLRTNGTFENAATYQAQSAVNIYTGNDSGYTDGAYAIGSYAEYSLIITAGNAAGNIKINGTDIAITEGETAAEIASAIASNVTIDGWTLSANDGTVIVKCNTIGNNTTSITFADTDSTGVTVSGNTTPSTTGTDVVRVYNNGTWTNAVLADYIADVWVSKDASWLGTISNHVVAQDTARQDQTVIEEKLIFNQNRTFGSGDTSYMSSPAAGFELGKKYKIVATLNKTSSAAVGIYKRKIAANNNPNVALAYIAAGTTTVTSYHTPTDNSTNYQYISAYASGTRSNLTWTVKIYEIVYKYLPEVKTELEEKIADVDAKIETNESDNVQLVMTNNYVRQNIVMNPSTTVWKTANAGYFSRLIQMEDGIYTLERVNTSKPILYAIVDSQYQHIGAVPTFIKGCTETNALTVELEGKKGWWLYVRDDDSSYTYAIPNIYFRRKDKFDVTNDAVDEIKYEKVLLDAGTITPTSGVIANRDAANLGNLVTNTSASYKSTDYIDISDYDKIQFTHLASGYNNTQQNTGAVFYDGSKTPITDYCFYRHMGVWGNATYTIDRPSNAKYIRTTLASTDAISRVYGYKERSNSGGSAEESTPKIIRRNIDAIEAIYAAKKMTKQAVGGSYNYNDPNHMLNFCIAHISDIHTDTERYINFRQFIDNVDGIDAAIHTGDTVINSEQNQYNNIKGIGGEKPVMDCVGNHDRGTANTSSSIHTPSLTTLKTWMRMDNLYYYQDFTKNEPVKNTLCYKIRVIVLNQYDFESDGTTHMSSLNATSIYSQTQLDWLVSTLQDALTNGYAVMIGMHTFDGNSWNSFKTNNKKFYDRIIARQDGAPFSGNKVIEDLINAFKNGGSINQTYTYADGSTATVNTSFASQGTFIAYMIGHGHRDIIAYSSNYPDQLYLGVNTGCLKGGYADRPYGTELSALARQAGDKSEDCFNVYGIDMKAKTVRVVRVGATLDDYFNKLDYDIYSF